MDSGGGGDGDGAVGVPRSCWHAHLCGELGARGGHARGNASSTRCCNIGAVCNSNQVRLGKLLSFLL